MAISQEENYLIEKIDFERSGQSYENLEEQIAYHDRLSNFCIRVVEKTVLEAEKFPNYNDLMLTMRVASFELALATEEKLIDVLASQSGLSKRGLRALPEDDERRIKYLYHLGRISLLKKQRWELQQCAYSRKFLRERNDWIDIYLIIKGYRNKHKHRVSELKSRYRVH